MNATFAENVAAFRGGGLFIQGSASGTETKMRFSSVAKGNAGLVAAPSGTCVRAQEGAQDQFLVSSLRWAAKYRLVASK